jgi:hypothetical protein
MAVSQGIMDAIKQVAPDLHKAGTFSPVTLEASMGHASKRVITSSAETGSGASTFLFSHLSRRHTVFAMDDGNGSIDNVRRSPLLNADVVEFVEGPTQKTLPRYEFREPLQLVLIDGPHGFPFPEMEYYYLYPHLEPGALLIVDDIQIRSIHNLFEFLKADAMFHLDEVVHTTAFFTRTKHPTFDPFADGWWEQKYNLTAPWEYKARALAKRLLPRAVVRSLRRH